MLIQSTKKLLQQLTVEEVEEEQYDDFDPLYRWHADIVTVDRLKSVVLVNEATYFTIIFYGLQPIDFVRFDEIIKEGIRTVFHDHCINEDVIDKYIHRYQSVAYGKTHNQSDTSHLTVLCDDLRYGQHDFETDTFVQSWLTRRLNKFPTQRNNETIVPKVELIQALEQHIQLPIFKTKAAVLKVNLQIEKHQLWREIVVPLRYNFRDLHDILQICYNWSGMHLHEFRVKDEDGKDQLHIGDLGMEYDLLPEVETLSEDKTYLEDILEKYPHIHYVYDFEKEFNHDIEVIRYIEDYDRNIPLCIDGEGVIRLNDEDEHVDLSVALDEDEFLFDETNQRFAQYFGA